MTAPPGAHDEKEIGVPNLGWYAFRHTYRTLLDDVGTPLGVQQWTCRHHRH